MKQILRICTIMLFITSQANADEEFAGFWKGNCSEAFGLQVMPVNDTQYTVSFCGPGGCFEPGTYRPNTTIKNDELYKVIDSRHIKVWGRDGWSDYYKCDSNTHPKLHYKDCDKKSPTMAGSKENSECRS
jgi:hypothetical protein